MILTPVKPVAPEPRLTTGALVVSSSPELETGTRLVISRELTAGREPTNDISIPADGYASAHHARFLRGERADVVEDLHSTNGTFVNGERLNGSRQLQAGDVITIGQTQLTYEVAT
jgi:pSer/pThr/pTyr-binding forkhead associated (FHA) protein